MNKVVYFTIRNDYAAKKLANSLIKSPNDSLILPFIDHPGPMSKHILSHDFRSLTVSERDDLSRNSFQAHIKNNYPQKKVNIHPHDLFDLSFQYHNHDAQQVCSEIIREILKSTDNAHIKFLVPLLRSKYEIGFLRNLYYQMSLKLGLCSDIRLHYYFLLSDRQYRYLTAKPSANLRNYRASSILYNTIFNISTLESFDLESCFEIPLKKIQKTSQNRGDSYKMVHLIWLEPKSDVIEDLGPRSLIEFRFLVNQMMQRRTVRVFSYLFNWFGDCANDIANLGISDDTRSGDMSVEQYLQLHLVLRRRYGYLNSTFLQAAASVEEHLNSIQD